MIGSTEDSKNRKKLKPCFGDSGSPSLLISSWTGLFTGAEASFGNDFDEFFVCHFRSNEFGRQLPDFTMDCGTHYVFVEVDEEQVGNFRPLSLSYFLI